MSDLKLSDVIAQAILELLEEKGGAALIQRNELAGKIGCVPSQINYVITSRFTPEHGFLVESRRGGGGFIRIERMSNDKSAVLMHLINSIGNAIDERAVRVIVDNLKYDKVISTAQARLFDAALGDTALKVLSPEQRGILRARIFKQMLLYL